MIKQIIFQYGFDELPKMLTWSDKNDSMGIGQMQPKGGNHNTYYTLELEQ